MVCGFLGIECTKNSRKNSEHDEPISKIRGLEHKLRKKRRLNILISGVRIRKKRIHNNNRTWMRKKGNSKLENEYCLYWKKRHGSLNIINDGMNENGEIEKLLGQQNGEKFKMKFHATRKIIRVCLLSCPSLQAVDSLKSNFSYF